MKKKFRKICIECKSTNVIYDEELNETVCQDCGAIHDETTPDEEEEEEEVSEESVPKKF